MLFQMSEDFRLALDEGRGERVYGELLESLDQYTRAHFGLEEQCMARCHCPAAELNSNAHAKFIEELTGFRRRYAAFGFEVADAQSLVEFIDHWLADHICRIDVQLRAFADISDLSNTQK